MTREVLAILRADLAAEGGIEEAIEATRDAILISAISLGVALAAYWIGI